MYEDMRLASVKFVPGPKAKAQSTTSARSAPLPKAHRDGGFIENSVEGKSGVLEAGKERLVRKHKKLLSNAGTKAWLDHMAAAFLAVWYPKDSAAAYGETVQSVFTKATLHAEATNALPAGASIEIANRFAGEQEVIESIGPTARCMLESGLTK